MNITNSIYKNDVSLIGKQIWVNNQIYKLYTIYEWARIQIFKVILHPEESSLYDAVAVFWVYW